MFSNRDRLLISDKFYNLSQPEQVKFGEAMKLIGVSFIIIGLLACSPITQSMPSLDEVPAGIEVSRDSIESELKKLEVSLSPEEDKAYWIKDYPTIRGLDNSFAEITLAGSPDNLVYASLICSWPGYNWEPRLRWLMGSMVSDAVPSWPEGSDWIYKQLDTLEKGQSAETYREHVKISLRYGNNGFLLLEISDARLSF